MAGTRRHGPCPASFSLAVCVKARAAILCTPPHPRHSLPAHKSRAAMTGPTSLPSARLGICELAMHVGKCAQESAIPTLVRLNPVCLTRNSASTPPSPAWLPPIDKSDLAHPRGAVTLSVTAPLTPQPCERSPQHADGQTQGLPWRRRKRGRGPLPFGPATPEKAGIRWESGFRSHVRACFLVLFRSPRHGA